MTRKPQLNGKTDNLADKLNLKQLELNALLEVTEAINANLPENALYRIYHFTLLSNLTISRMVLFVLDEQWECKVHYGVPANPDHQAYISEALLKCSTITPAYTPDALEGFDVIIPILHKSKNLAFVFLGGIPGQDPEDEDNPVSFVQTLTSILIVAIENKKLARKQLQQEALKKELEIASKVQNNLFPSSLPSNDRIELKASYLPHLQVGGDYYDYIELPEDRFLFCIADVSGKGIPAALLMSSFQSGLRTLVRRTNDLEDIVHELNHLVKTNSHGDRFITFFCAIANLRDHTLVYINAGHNPPYFIQDREITELNKGTTVLGAFDRLPFMEKETIGFSPGNFLFAYTDGLSEAVNEAGEEFGTQRLTDFLLKDKPDMQCLHHELMREVKAFKGKSQFPDDITFLSCTFH